MENSSTDLTTRHYQVSVTFHVSKNIENYYKVVASTASDAKKRAIDEACNDLNVIKVDAVGAGMYGVFMNFCNVEGSECSFVISAAKEVEAVKMAKNQAKKDFTAKVIFYVDN